MLSKTKLSVIPVFCVMFFFCFNVLICNAIAPPMNVVFASVDAKSKEVSLNLITNYKGKDFVITVTDPNGKIDYTENVTPTETTTKISYTTKSLVYGKYNVVAECEEENQKYSTSFSYYVFGDVNCDGKVNSIDYTIMRRFILQQIDEFAEPQWRITADLNRDKKVNSIDYSILRKYILELTEDIPVITLDIEKINWRTEIRGIIGEVYLELEGTTNADKLAVPCPIPGSPGYVIEVDSEGKFKESLMVAYVEPLEAKSYVFRVDITAKTDGVKDVTFRQESGELTFEQ